MLTNILLSILLLLIGMFIFDMVPIFYTWQSRIKIGKWDKNILWEDKILKKTLQWLKNTPTIPLTDNSRLILIDIIKGDYSRSEIQYWQEASLLLGLIQNYKKTGSTEIKNAIEIFVNNKIAKNGVWKKEPKEIDGAILAYAIMKVDWLDHEKNKPAYKHILQVVNNLIGKDGTIAYREHVKKYRFVDTIGFVSPFLIAYGVKFKDNTYIELGMNQISKFNKYGMLSDQFIPCHTYNMNTNIPVGLFGWGRGLGWYAIGLIDAWNEIPNNHDRKKEFTKSVIAFAKMALKFQRSDGAWGWMVVNQESQPDSSTTATLAWFLANASQIKDIELACISGKRIALNYLKKVTRRDGAIDFSQGDTKGIGIHSQKFDILPFTQGFCLRTIYY